MEKTNQQQSGGSYYLLSFLILLAVVAGFWFYVRPLWDEVASLEMGRDEMLAERDDMQARLDALKQVEQQVEEGSEVAREMSLTAIPERFEEENLIMDIAELSRENDVTMGGISFGIPGDSASGSIVTATINLNLTGEPGKLLGFLKGVEANPRKMVVKSIAVQNASDESGLELANYNLNIETYYQGSI